MKIITIFVFTSMAIAQTRVSGNVSNSWVVGPVPNTITIPNVVAGNLIVGCSRFSDPHVIMALSDPSHNVYTVDASGQLGTATSGSIAMWHTVANATVAALTISAPGTSYWASAAEQYSTAAAGATWALDGAVEAHAVVNPIALNGVTLQGPNDLTLACASVAETTLKATIGSTYMSMAQMDQTGYMGMLDFPIQIAAPTSAVFSVSNGDASPNIGAIAAAFRIVTVPVQPGGSAFIPVRNEQPAFATAANTTSGGSYGTYTLLHPPLYGVSCFIGTQRQFPVTYSVTFPAVNPPVSPQTAYAVTGAVITSGYWDLIATPGDIFCDYEYKPGT